MHIVTRPSMLTLTVERLVGNSDGGHNSGHRMSLSPESSDTGSDISSVTSPAKSSPPSHFSKISLLLSNSRIPPDGLGHGRRSPMNGDDEGSHHQHNPVSLVKSENNEREDDLDGKILIREEDRIIINSETSANHEGEDCIDDNERPPSSNSWGSSSKSVCGTSSSILSQPNLNFNTTPTHNSTKLKFSIHDILRPDFGQRAITKIRRNIINNIDRDNNGNKRRSRPSSVKNHSEDSNSSCASSRREEVVDEAKVNPEVPKGPLLWPAWVYCTRYSDRPSSGPRSRRILRKNPGSTSPRSQDSDEKRPRTAFTAEQLGRLKQEFDENRYLTEKRRQDLARDLKLHENQIKIWFQNKRAKLKKSTGQRGGLAIQLMAQGLYNHSTVPMDEDEDYLPC